MLDEVAKLVEGSLMTYASDRKISFLNFCHFKLILIIFWQVLSMKKILLHIENDTEIELWILLFKSNYYSIQRGSINLCICNFLRKHDTHSTSVSSFPILNVISAFFTVYRQGGNFKIRSRASCIIKFFCDTVKN
jgi:hypothetical protein